MKSERNYNTSTTKTQMIEVKLKKKDKLLQNAR